MMRLTTPVYFDYDKSDIRPDQEGTLNMKLSILKANPNVRIRIEGNADERGSSEYNIALGMRRANQSRVWLVTRGIPESRIDVTSYGVERPVCQEHAESCWSRNRRDEFVVTAGGSSLRPGGEEEF
jgi:peptidoglycan-associated lipoprotein